MLLSIVTTPDSAIRRSSTVVAHFRVRIPLSVPVMPDEEYIASVLHQYFNLVMAAPGLSPSDWGYAHSVRKVVQQVLARHYYYHPNLSLQEETEIIAALEELDQCSIGQVGVLSSWGQVQAGLGRVVPLAVRLLRKKSN